VGNETITKDAPKGDEDGDKIRTVPVYPDILDMLQAFRLEQRKRQLADLIGLRLILYSSANTAARQLRTE
jgi:hypothetical protein